MMVRFLIFVAVLIALGTLAVTSLTGLGGVPYAGPSPPLDRTEVKREDRIHEHVEYISFQIGKRHHRNPGGLQKTSDYIRDVLSSMGYKPTDQTYPVGGQLRRNIVAELGGSILKNEIIVIGASYDSPRRSPGANMNASGVAVLLELAREMRGKRVSRTVRFVFFSTGMQPHVGTDDMGSRHYAQEILDKGDNVVAMLSLRSLGSFKETPQSQDFPFPLNSAFPDTGNFLAAFGGPSSRKFVQMVVRGWNSRTPLPMIGSAMPWWSPGVMESDHESFAAHGIPAIVISDTGTYRHVDTGTVYDLFERLDYATMSRVVTGLVGLVRNFPRLQPR
jgi:hypothetical protein